MMPTYGGRDYVDHIVEAIGDRYSPDVVEAKALAYRLRRLAHRLETEIRRELAPYGVELWELEILACLHRSGPRKQMTAGQLMAQLQVTSGAITNRVTQLERRKWVIREFDQRDRRSVLVTLTEAGEARALEVFSVKTESEHKLLSGLPPPTLRAMNGYLRTLLSGIE